MGDASIKIKENILMEPPRRQMSTNIYLSGSDMWGIWKLVDAWGNSDCNVYINKYGDLCFEHPHNMEDGEK